MKTRELIALLQAEDPSGELPVCVSNEDILDVCRMPAYYDGPLEQFDRPGPNVGLHRVTGARIIRAGEKVKIRAWGIEDLLCDYPELPVEGNSADAASIARWREQGRELKAQR